MAAMDADLMATASTLSKAIRAQGHRIDTLQNDGGPPVMPGRSDESLLAALLKEDVKGRRADLFRINAEYKPHMVKFAGLNLDSLA